MDFSEALVWLKKGYKLQREGWNGRGMFIYFVPANQYPAQTEVARKEFGEKVSYGSYVAMKTAAGNVVPWLCSNTDLFAEDWAIIN